MSAPFSRDYYQGLLEHGQPTSRQREIIEAVMEYGTQCAAAEALGLAQSCVSRPINACRKKAARKGFAPEHDQHYGAPDGQKTRGYSTLRRGDGEVLLQWEKTQPDLERQHEIMREACEAMKAEIPSAEAVERPLFAESSLLTQYTLTDYHLGQLSWAPETGGDWDTEIAESMLYRWFSTAIAMAPNAHTGVFAQLGDLIHYDSLLAITPTNAHILDADTRYAGVVRVAIRASRRIIRELLAKHAHVHVIMCEGNHDESGSVWLRELLAAHYEREPRVTVDTSPSPFNAYRWGDVSLFYHHGHKVRIPDLARVFASEFRELFGCTRRSYGHCGHYHHRESKEDALMYIERHPTIAERDAHAARGGYRALRGATAIDYDCELGEIGRRTIPPDMAQRFSERAAA